MPKSFPFPEIVKHFKVPSRNFSVQWEQRNWQKIVTLLISKIIWYQDVSETHKGSPTKLFGAVRRKNFVRKSWYTPFMPNFCRYPKTSETMKGSPTKGFCTVRKNESTKLSYSYYPKKVDTRTLLKHRKGPLWNFLVLRDKKNSSENRDITLECLNFSIPGNSETLQGSPRKFFGIVRTKNWQKIVILVISIIIWYQDVSETHKGSPTKIFGAVRRKIFVRKSWCTPFMLNFCQYPKISETMKRFPRINSVPWNKKINKTVILLLTKKKQKSSWNTEGFPYEHFWYCETKIFQQKLMVLLISTKSLISEQFWNT